MYCSKKGTKIIALCNNGLGLPKTEMDLIAEIILSFAYPTLLIFLSSLFHCNEDTSTKPILIFSSVVD